MKNKLAIVIPAYKQDFLKETLDSIAAQTKRDFNLYIGNDDSPSDLYKIIAPFMDKIKIIYKRFDNNLGGSNLVDHWKRCIDLVQDEEWIWLFSDDDVMDRNCVELFYNALEENQHEDIFHFNVQVIDQHNRNLKPIRYFPDLLSSEIFFKQRISKKLFSFAVEYIFKKEAFIRESGFQQFDLAWASDDATWIKLGRIRGIKTIKGALVKWRLSGTNISSLTGDKVILSRKLDAHISFLLWATSYFEQYQLKNQVSPITKIKWLLTLPIYSNALKLKDKLDFIKTSLQILGLKQYKTQAVILLLYGEGKKLLKKKLIS